MKNIRITSALLAVSLFTSIARAEEPPAKQHEAKGEYNVRFFCPAFNMRPKYVKDARGNLIRIRAETNELPPQMVYIKKNQKDDIQVQLVSDALTPPVIIPAKGVGGGPLDVQAGAIEWSEGKEIKGMDSRAVATLVKHPFLKLAIEPGTPMLVCLFQPELHGNWMPPKQVISDLSLKKFPANSALVLNLTGTPVAVAIGEGSAVAQIPAAGQFMATPTKVSASGTYVAKIAAKTKAGYTVLLNAEREIPEGKRVLVIISHCDPAANAGLTENILWQELVDPVPPKDEEKTAK